MPLSRSPPRSKKFNSMGGSNLSLNSTTSSSALLDTTTERQTSHSYCHHHHQYQYHHQHSHNHRNSAGGGHTNSNGNDGNGVATTRRGGPGKRNNWGKRERAGMSFLIVIAFFAVFGIIILTELFVIDGRLHTGVTVYHHSGNRFGDSVPDYDNVKDDYDLLDENFNTDNKLGFVQFKDNTLRIQDANKADSNRWSGVLLSSDKASGLGLSVTGVKTNNGLGGGGGGGAVGVGVGGGVGLAPIPWGKVLPAIIEETLPHFPFGITPTDASWQIVNGTRFKFFIFSAFYDQRDDGRLVRVIGATKTRGPDRVWCRFWYKNATTATSGGRNQYTSTTVLAKTKMIREHFNLKYSACFVLCPVRDQVPSFVSIVARLRSPPGNLLVLRNTPWDEDFPAVNQSLPRTLTPRSSVAAGLLPLPKPADTIGVCVKPFHFSYDLHLHLIEFLEFYSLLGVSHFTFYNDTVGPHAACVLDHYIRGDVPGNLTAWDEVYMTMPPTLAARSKDPTSGPGSGTPKPPTVRRYSSPHYARPSINILPWNLRMKSQKDIRTEGLFAALNDCLYRSMYRYKYAALIDFDECLIPRRDDTLRDLIESLHRRYRSRSHSAGSYSFQNAFFYLQFPDDVWVTQPNHLASSFGISARLRAALVTQRKTRRRRKLHPQKQRSKYICKPEDVIEAGNHFVWEFAKGKGSMNVPPDDAVSHHYRICEFGGDDCIKSPSTVDRTATKYANRLGQRVQSVYSYLKRSCDLPDLPPVIIPSPKTADNANDYLKPIINNEKQSQKSKQTVKSSNDHAMVDQKATVRPTPSVVKSNEKVYALDAKKATRATSTVTPSTTTESVTPTTTTTTRASNPPTSATIAKPAPPQKATNNLPAEKEGSKPEASPKAANFKKRKRKIVIFELNPETGEPEARVEYT